MSTAHPPGSPPVAGVQVTGTRRGLVLACVMLAMFMAAIEGTIVATAMPHIVAELGGFSLYTWVFSGFLLAQAVATPVAGKLADLYGRRPVFTAGVGVFLTGSVLCGMAPTMVWLVVLRVVQGVGAGAVQPIAATLVGDLYTLEERSRIQGWLSSTWGISAVLGPVIGGVIVQYAHWSWIFWLHLPFGLFAIVGVRRFLRERVDGHRRTVDYAGAAWFFVGCSAILLLLVQGGVAFPWVSTTALSLAALGALAVVGFVHRERRAREPLMELSLWRHPLIRVANGATLTAGMMLIGLTTFVPTFVQGVLGRGPVVAGFTLTAVSIGWPTAAVICGRLLPRLGARITARIGGVFLCLGGLVFVLPPLLPGPWWPALGSLCTGAGMGFANTTFIVSIQSAVAWGQRASATASNLFMRMFGSALGAAALGGVLNQRLQQLMGVDAADLADVRRLLGHGGAAVETLDPGLRAALAGGLEWVFIGILVCAVATFVQALRLPLMGYRG